MYHHLTGKLTLKRPTQIAIDVGGVGYELSIPLSTYHRLPEAGETVTVLAHFHVREDAHQLFGFLTDEERNLFRLLNTVTGIGPKLALCILSGIEIQDLKRAIMDENLAVLTSVSGIGRKTAERLIIELREKVMLDEKELRQKAGTAFSEQDALTQDVLLALVNLGYKKQSAQEAIKKAISSLNHEKVTVGELVRVSLKVI